MIQYLGSYTVGGLMPTMVGVLGSVIGRLNGQLAGALRVSGQLGFRLPTVAARIEAVGRLAAQLQVTPPGVKFNISANASLIAALKAQLKILAAIYAAFGTSGVEAFIIESKAGAAGGEFNNAIGNGLPGGTANDQVYALVLATRFPATFAAMGEVFIQ